LLFTHFMLRSKDTLKDVLAALSTEECGRMFDLIFMERGGILHTKRKRLQVMLSGSAARSRIGWSDFFLTCCAAFGNQHADFEGWDPDDLDFSDVVGDDFPQDHCDILDRYIEHIHDISDRFPKFPVSLLPDLERDVDDGKVVFSLPDGFEWPAQQAVLGHAGVDGSDSGSGSGNSADAARMEEMENLLAEYKDQLNNMPESVKDMLKKSISENAFGVSGDNSLATLRKTLQYKVAVDEFYLFDHAIAADGSRTVICDGTAPLSRDMLDKLFFDNVMSSKDSQKIERRTLMDERVFISARHLSDAKTQVLGGTGSKEFRDYDILRVRQQAHVKNSQPLLKIIHHASRSVGSASAILERHDDHTDGLDLDTLTVDTLQIVRDELYSVLHGASDALHLVCMECSELERKRDDLYIQAASGNKNMRVARPSADPLRTEKDTSELDRIAAVELQRQKALGSTRAGSNPRDRGKPAPRAGSPAPKKPRPDTAERGRRKDQSERAKAHHGKDDKKTGAAPKGGQPKNGQQQAKKTS
jgi:hypothetical protein